MSQSLRYPPRIAGIGRTSSVCSGEEDSILYSSRWSSVPIVSSIVVQKKVFPVYRLCPADEDLVATLDEKYEEVDRVSKLAIIAARKAINGTGWNNKNNVGVCVGSSRGATSSLETAIATFSQGKPLSPLTSPITTAGSIATDLARDFSERCSIALTQIVALSSTCTSTVTAISTSLGWLNAGVCDCVIVGAAEAPLTPFTLAMMNSLRIYASSDMSDVPCKPLNERKINSFVLGEGSSFIAVEKVVSKETKPYLAILGVGMGFEVPPSRTGMSVNGDHFFQSLERAYQQAGFPDAIVLHATGAVKGDLSELAAVERFIATYGKDKLRPVSLLTTPQLFAPKFLTGHTFGAAAGLSLDYALSLLKGETLPLTPYPSILNNLGYDNAQNFKNIQKVFVNSGGFGGNAGTVAVGWWYPDQ